MKWLLSVTHYSNAAREGLGGQKTVLRQCPQDPLKTGWRWEAAQCQNQLLCSKRDTGQMPGGTSQPQTSKETVTIDSCLLKAVLRLFTPSILRMGLQGE